MNQTTKSGWRWAVGAAVVAMGLFSGCAHDKTSSAQVKEEWVARVPQEQLAPVEDARAVRREAKDDVTRAEVALSDSKNEHKVAQTRLSAAESGLKVEQSVLKTAQGRGDAAAIEDANQRVMNAQKHVDAAKAAVEMAQKKVDVENANLALAKSKEKLGEAEVQRAQYQVLSQANDTRVQSMTPQSFDAEVAKTQADIAQKESQLVNEEAALRMAETRWQQLDQQARASSNP